MMLNSTKEWLFWIVFIEFNTNKNLTFQFVGTVRLENAAHVRLKLTGDLV